MIPAATPTDNREIANADLDAYNLFTLHVGTPDHLRDWTTCGGCGITEPSAHTKDGFCVLCIEGGNG